MVSGKEKTLLLGAVLPTAACLALLLVQWHSAGCRFVEHTPGSSLLICTQHVRFVGDQRTVLVRVRSKEGILFRRREVRGEAAGRRVGLSKVRFVGTGLCCQPAAGQRRAGITYCHVSMLLLARFHQLDTT